jgi:dTDP-4-amino-4,6-dideoxygalactose transaminase
MKIKNLRLNNYYHLKKKINEVSINMPIEIGKLSAAPQTLPILDATGTLMDHLQKNGIGAYSWPNKEIPKEVAKNKKMYKNSNYFNKNIICLPIHQSIDNKHILKIGEVIDTWHAAKHES